MVLTVGIDILIQVIFEKNILGYPITLNKPSSFFGTEHIAGGYIQKFSLFLYLAMGWLIAFKINTLIDLISFNGLALIIASGLLYTFGTYFYSSEKIKYSHAIWHLFVLGGSITHYFFVLFFII